MKQLLGIKLQVQCADGATHDGVKLFVEDNQRVYVAEDGSVLSNVDLVLTCTAVVPPMVLAMALNACKRCEP